MAWDIVLTIPTINPPKKTPVPEGHQFLGFKYCVWRVGEELVPHGADGGGALEASPVGQRRRALEYAIPGHRRHQTTYILLVKRVVVAVDRRQRLVVLTVFIGPLDEPLPGPLRRKWRTWALFAHSAPFPPPCQATGYPTRVTLEGQGFRNSVG